MRGAFLKATSCADCDIKSEEDHGNCYYCPLVKDYVTDRVESNLIRERHPNCPLVEIHTVKEATGAWLKAEEADGLCGEDCGCGIDDLFPCDGEYCKITDCIPAKKSKNNEGEDVYVPLDKEGKLEATNE